ncbi:hypothetical protein GQ473_05735 [archaeon]|nr:hypothetical protein [archaeon]
MELEESVATIFYIFLFAAFITITHSQSDWFKTTVTGLDTLSEFQTDLVNDFVYSSCFIATNNQGNNIHGVFDTDLLDKHTEKKLISEIIELAPLSTDYTIHYAPTVDDCVNTKDNFYFYEVREKEGPKTQWIFGSSEKLGFGYDKKTWTFGKKPISIKRGNIISSGIIRYGFSKNPPKAGIAFVAPKTTTEICNDLGGIKCDPWKKCIGDDVSYFEMWPSGVLGPTLDLTIEITDSEIETESTSPIISQLCCYDGGVCES